MVPTASKKVDHSFLHLTELRNPQRESHVRSSSVASDNGDEQERGTLMCLDDRGGADSCGARNRGSRRACRGSNPAVAPAATVATPADATPHRSPPRLSHTHPSRRKMVDTFAISPAPDRNERNFPVDTRPRCLLCFSGYISNVPYHPAIRLQHENSTSSPGFKSIPRQPTATTKFKGSSTLLITTSTAPGLDLITREVLQQLPIP